MQVDFFGHVFEIEITTWLIIGFIGQGFFSMRFIVQWLASEKQKKSVIPMAFWYFSLLGGATLFAYAVHQEDPVFIFGQGLGLFIYLRNLYFVTRDRAIKKEKIAEKSAVSSTPAE